MDTAHRAGQRLVVAALTLCALTSCGACKTSDAARKDIVYQIEAGEGPSIFVDADELIALSGEGAALLDARGSWAYRVEHIVDAAHAPWDQFTEGLLSGVIDEDTEAIEDALQDMGVRSDKPVVIYGDWSSGWGEEGRVFWTLEYLGHRDVRVLYGGMPRWLAEGRPTESFSSDPAKGDFAAAPIEERRATADQIHGGLGKGQAVLLDVRTKEEYEGATPYGASRGGHIPGAHHFFWRDLFEADGNLKPRASLLASLREAGVDGERRVISYCTGGVRSGFMYMLMRWLGVAAPQNYDGSWWDWASRESLPVEG